MDRVQILTVVAWSVTAGLVLALVARATPRSSWWKLVPYTLIWLGETIVSVAFGLTTLIGLAFVGLFPMWAVLIMTNGRVERVVDPGRRANPAGYRQNSMTPYERRWFWVVTICIIVGSAVAVLAGGNNFFPTGS